MTDLSRKPTDYLRGALVVSLQDPLTGESYDDHRLHEESCHWCQTRTLAIEAGGRIMREAAERLDELSE